MTAPRPGGEVAVLLDARQRALVESGLTVVDRVLRTLRRRYASLVDPDELASLGRAGLVAAARAYDPSRATPFDAFAWGHVHGAMMAGVRDEAQHRAIARAAREGAHAVLGSLEDDADVLRDGDADHRARVDRSADALVASMVAAIGARLAAPHGEELAIERQTHAIALRALDAATAELPERDRRLIGLVYRDDVDLGRAAATLGLSYMTARRVHRSAVDRLAVRLRARGVTAMPTAGA